jgi:hypothetical protein
MTIAQIAVVCSIVYLFDSMNVIAHAVGIFIVSIFCFCILGKDEKYWPLRQDIWAMARSLFVVMWFAGVVGYCGWYFSSPHLFDFSSTRLCIIAPLVSLAPAFLSLILTLCAGDTALLILGREEKESQ